MEYTCLQIIDRSFGGNVVRKFSCGLMAGSLAMILSLGQLACLAGGKKLATPTKLAATGKPAGGPVVDKYLEQVKSGIMYYWYPARADEQFCTIRFRLHKNGNISWVELTDASNVEAVNQAAEDAIARAVPFPLPPAVLGDCVDLSADFSSSFMPVSQQAYSRPVGQLQVQRLIFEAQALQKKGSVEKAIEMLERAHELSPFDRRVSDSLIENKIAFAKDKAPEQALSLMHECLLLGYKNQSARNRLNELLHQSGRKADDPKTRVELARDYTARGRLDDALSEYGEAWLLRNDPLLISEINTCLDRRKNYAAVRKWQNALKTADTNVNHLALAQAYESCAMPDRAIEEYRVVLSKDSDNSAARKALGTPSKPIVPAKESGEIVKPSESRLQLSDDFPYLEHGSCNLKIKTLANRRVAVDYLKQASPTTLMRWAANRIPLTVYIDPGNNVRGFRPQMRQQLIDSFSAWQAASDKRIRYIIVGGPTGANIICHWTCDPKDKRMSGYEQGITSFKYLESNPKCGMVQSAEITILIRDRFAHNILSDAAMKAVCLHELGHSLGISGHSPFKGDIMFPSFTINGSFPTSLSERDTATIRRLYQAYSHPHV